MEDSKTAVTADPLQDVGTVLEPVQCTYHS